MKNYYLPEKILVLWFALTGSIVFLLYILDKTYWHYPEINFGSGLAVMIIFSIIIGVMEYLLNRGLRGLDKECSFK